jgi:UDP-3-O-acyl-N-acetylglucosamine deacetylase
MARYRLKRKTFNILSEAGGSVMDSTGKVLNNGVVSTAAGIATATSPVGDMAADALGDIMPGGRLIGKIAAYKAGKELTKGIGQGLSDTGKDWQAKAAAGM